MVPFMNKDFLLETETAKKLYHEYAKEMPIIDYHCHLTAKEIAENKHFSSLTQAWLSDDHYKWRALRANGVSEEFVTGEENDSDKFQKWAETVPNLIGNPLYHWTHLELQRCFGITDILTPETAESIWNECNAMLQKDQLTPKEIIKQFNVKALCTTDDPIDSLDHHKSLKEDVDFPVQVLPTFRPDGALNVDKGTFVDWVKKLEGVTGIKVQTYLDFTKALEQRVDYFHEVGCRLSDHGLDSAFFSKTTVTEVQTIFTKALNQEVLNEKEVIQFKTAVLIFLGRLYAQKGWAMQLHIGGLRNTNTRMIEKVGPNTGYDSIADFTYARDLACFLDELEKTSELPKTVLYCLNPRDNYMVATLAGNFQSEVPGKIQFGTAWWFNDQRDGMEDQIRTLANVGVLSNFVGMLTDSRSLLSYTRHEYFRRILCNVIGKWVENGEYPADFEHLGKIVKDISFNNIEHYLALDKEM
ncbi:glucuronate isomerase [Halalkalibacter akibai]|uniref:Uronate isomerase n=1 Tax=Halalkalibacter akibai (strain ATCC 43226 / DSM 21942 / CIP 109018 / JCM 9157 / 1139) TaxID=1236973 RepID=W4QXJ7_HALA3|nr:glucuronate isomerase [Halalkalibacter akibai]GAE36363.1 uronate isomerase [Halalkalibacter akibai JCM 9157]